MSKIITISREFGSGGRYIGERVAKTLGIDYYDKQIIEKIAEKTGLSRKFIEKASEYAPSKNIFAYSFIARTNAGVSVDDYLNNIQRELILEVADKGPCVIIGRCADYILHDRDDRINVFIHGNSDVKAKRISKLYDVTEAEAKKLMKETDKKRSINYNYYTEHKWGDMRNYTITLNSSEIGIDKCADIICELCK